MIRYTLLCPQDHSFESWFRDSESFEALGATGQVTCPVCGTTEVRKALMTPSVVTSRARSTPPALPAPAASVQPEPAHEPVALLDERTAQRRAAMRELRRRITEQADDVGRAFATEARLIHEGDAPARSIYGEATGEEVSSLLEDGIPLLPMPVLPDDRH